MRIVRDLHPLSNTHKGAAIALGNFDGVHLGHRAILDACVKEAKRLGCPAAVMTFEPHPREFFTKSEPKLRIASFHTKMALLAAHKDIDIVYLARFNRQFASTPAAVFVGDILHKHLGARHIVTGYNFAFGKGREGNAEFLAEEAARHAMSFTAIAPVLGAHGQPVSSSAIRTLLSLGNMESAAAMLGRPYRMSGHVKKGEQRGRALGFPTANLSLGKLFVPKLGIYAARVWFGNEAQPYDAVASIGTNPTFGGTEALLEVHIFDSSRMCYGHRLHVELLAFMRDEAKFPDAESLRVQMGKDCADARAVLQQKRSA